MKNTKIITILLVMIFFIKTTVAMQPSINFSLLQLPTEHLHPIILDSINGKMSLEDDIKGALQLRKTCKYFNNFLSPECTGQSFRHYSQKEKDTTLKKLLRSMNDLNYHNKRYAALILTYTGAHNEAYKNYPLLKRAVQKNDIEMVSLLFKHGANPNQKTIFCATFFDVKTVAITQMFIAQGVGINIADLPCYPNVLWKNITHNDSSELVKLYLDQGVDTKQIGLNNNCILHHLVNPIHVYSGSTNYIKTSELLLEKSADMINVLNKEQQTPLDLAQAIIKDLKQSHPNYKLLIDLIALYKKYGAKTAQQLRDEKLT